MSDHEPNPFVKVKPVMVGAPNVGSNPNEAFDGPPSGFEPAPTPAGHAPNQTPPWVIPPGQHANPSGFDAPPKMAMEIPPSMETVWTFDYVYRGKNYRANFVKHPEGWYDVILRKWQDGKWCASASSLKPAILGAFLVNSALKEQEAQDKKAEWQEAASKVPTAPVIPQGTPPTINAPGSAQGQPATINAPKEPQVNKTLTASDVKGKDPLIEAADQALKEVMGEDED